MTVFISQAMNGRTEKEIKEERDRAVQIVKNKLGPDVKIIDSYINDAPEEANPIWFLGKSLEHLSKADYAYFCDGWSGARGCRIEHVCAVEYGIPIIQNHERGRNNGQET